MNFFILQPNKIRGYGPQALVSEIKKLPYSIMITRVIIML